MYNVLLIDFDKRSREAFANKINWKHHGFTLQTFENSFSALLSVCKQRHYDMILINLKGSQVHGLDVCKRIRNISSIPILLIGGSKDFQFVRESIRLQVIDYLPAPITLVEFTKTLVSLKQILQKEKINFNLKPSHSLKTSPKRNIADIIDEVKRQVEASLNRHITLKEISDELHYNCCYLGQKFKTYENMTFPEYVLIRRMEKAKYLLSHTDLKIYQVAAEVGFSDLDWFYKKFKAHTGVTASVFRKNTSSSSLSSLVV